MRSTITILLVDDHAIVRQGCRLLLQQAGFEIAGEAASGEDAYASCLQHSPRVVIMDLAMPAWADSRLVGASAPALPSLRWSCSQCTTTP